MDSETSENTDTISADLITNVFNTLPSPLPSNMSRLEFSIYRTYAFLIPGSRQMAPFSLVLSVFNIIQVFAVINIFIIMDKFYFCNSDIRASPDKTVQTFYFFLTFRFYTPDDMGAAYYCAIIFIAILCISSFIYVLIIGLHNRLPSPIMQCFYIAFVIDIPQVLLFVFTFQFARSAVIIISQTDKMYIFQTVIMGISLIFLYVMCYLATNILQQSIFYHRGSKICYPTYISLNTICMIILFASNIFFTLITLNQYRILMTILFSTTGVYCISIGFLRVYLYEAGNSLSIASGSILLTSSIYNIILLTNHSVEPELYLFINILVFIFAFIISLFAFNFHAYKSAEKIKKDPRFFNHKKKMGNYALMFYSKIAFKEALPSAINLTFLDQALKYPRPNWVYFGLLRYSFLINENSPKVDQLKEKISMKPSTTLSNIFIDIERKFYHYANVINDIPDEYKKILNDLETKIAQFQTASKTLTSKISDDFKVDYLLTDALGSMHDLITNEIMIVKRYMPNSIMVLQLYSSYKKHVCGEEEEASKLKELIADMKKGDIMFADYTHLHALDIFPKMQSKLLKFSVEKRRKDDEKRGNDASPFVTGLPPIQNSSNWQKSQQALIQIFGNQKSFIYIFARLVCYLFIILMLFHTFYTFSTTTTFQNNLQYCYNMIDCHFNSSIYYGYFINNALDIIYNHYDNQTDYIQKVKENATHYQNINKLYADSYRIGASSSNLFYETFEWFTRNNYLAPSTDSKSLLYIDIGQLLIRFTSLFLSNYPTDYNFTRSTELPSFIHTTQYFPSYYAFTNDIINTTTYKYIDKLSLNIYFSSWYSSIPCFIFAFLMMLTPILFYGEFRRLIDLFPHDQSKHSQTILDTFLSFDFSVFSSIIIKYYIINVFLAGIVISLIFSINGTYHSAVELIKDRLNTVFISSGHIARQNSVIAFLYLHLLKGEFDLINTTLLNTGVQESLTYFSTDYRYSRYNSYFDDTVNTTNFIFLTMRQFKHHQIEPNIIYMYQMMGITGENVTPAVILLKNECMRLINYYTRLMAVNSCSITIIFIILIMIFYILENRLISIMWRNLSTLKMMLTQLPEKYVSSSEKLVELLQNHTQLSQFSSFKKSTILDLMNSPCALINKDNIILSTNRYWLTFFNQSLDYTIGKPVFKFLNDLVIKHSIKDVTDDLKLFIIDENKMEHEYKKQIHVLKEKVEILKSSIVPTRFIKEKHNVTEQVPFVIACSLILMPIRMEELNPDDYVADIREFEQLIIERCHYSDDVDILWDSGRELQILFGVNQKKEKHYLAIESMAIMLEILRLSIEHMWKSVGIHTSIFVASGENVEFQLNNGHNSIMEMFGPAFSKLMILKEKIEVYSIICDAATYQLIDDCETGVVFDQLDEDSFIFKLNIMDEQYSPLKRIPSNY
ncbi:hypothetical protein TRFO_33737 [Tritrichomonas foetus]|uniref:Uncharacterized protein n=1 Tax=Tritrichomonas foetus TaxID=1144522 RepID=A0A1J4JQH7_9EUKA|nr:hypothetical protein TRFO_33737 [Tritrichomonas foetus]|eukprot:OHS99771.1 hypothetical protein TRFO_33737 [Tritrichomonas foetus]